MLVKHAERQCLNMQTVPEAVQTAYHGPLTRVSGSCPQPVDDPLWFQLTRVGGVSLSAVEPSCLYKFIEPFAVQLARNNVYTGHYALLVSHSVETVGAASSFASQVTAQAVQVASNCIILLRNLTVVLLHQIPPSALRRVLLASSGQEASQDVLFKLVSTCLAYIDQVELSVHTYSLYHANLEMLIACCCSSLYHVPDRDAGMDLMLQILHTQQQHQHTVVTRLLNNILRRLPVPHSVLYQPPNPQDGIASMLGTMNTLIMFPARAVSSLWRQDSWGETASPAASASLSLLLLLLHQTKCPSGSQGSQFLAAFQDLGNTDGLSQESVAPSEVDSTLKVASVSFSALFEWLVDSAQDEQTTMLLYSLLTRSPAFRQALVVRSDIDRLILPLLEQVYKDSTQHINHLYIIQIILLVLSQDEGLARTVYKVRLQKVPWYSDRNGLDISVGDLILVVLLKSAFRNATTVQDEYVHTNSMSTMINLAPHAAKISPVSAQRLCSSIEASHKRLLWLDQKLVEALDKRIVVSERQLVEDLLQNLIVFLDILVYRTLARNPELVYSMLHQQAVLLQLAGEPAWGKHLRNTHTVVQRFNSCVDSARHALAGSRSQGEEWSVAQVMGVIQRELLSFKISDLHAVDDMHCTYEEAPQACDFFLPYVWSTIIDCPTSQYYHRSSGHFSDACNNEGQ